MASVNTIVQMIAIVWQRVSLKSTKKIPVMVGKKMKKNVKSN